MTTEGGGDYNKNRACILNVLAGEHLFIITLETDSVEAQKMKEVSAAILYLNQSYYYYREGKGNIYLPCCMYRHFTTIVIQKKKLPIIYLGLVFDCP